MRRLLWRWGPYVALLALAALIWAIGDGWWRYLAFVVAGVLLAYALRPRRRAAWLTLGLVVILAATAAVITLTIDLGPTIRQRAERAGTSFLKRPMRIGRLGIHLGSGRFVVENVVIEGMTPADKPFFDAKRITVAFPWWIYVRTGQVFVNQIDLADWRMQIESYGGGRHNIPSFGSGRQGGGTIKTRIARVAASRGEFTFIDHGTWQTVARSLDITVVNTAGLYSGRAVSSGGVVQVQDSLPMSAALEAAFTIADGKVRLSALRIDTDGARTTGTGEVNVRRWPEQHYDVESVVDFRRAREIFFPRETWRSQGEGRFKGRFRLAEALRELKGDFSSDLVHVNDFAFGNLRGSLVWTRDRFEVFDAASRFYGGRTAFYYRIAPLGRASPKQARFDATYRDVDLSAFTDFLATRGLRLAGTITGQSRLDWTLGRFSEVRGEGTVTAAPPPGVAVLPRVPTAAEALTGPPAPEMRPENNPREQTRRFSIGGEVRYRLGPEWVEMDPSWVATPATYVSFYGRTAWGERSNIPFYVRSGDWQESDDFMSSVLTAFGSPTSTVRVGGSGEFRGVMLNSFRLSRVEGNFRGEDLRAWDVVWGQARGHIVVENSYVEVAGGVFTKGDSETRVDGRFSLSVPRRDGGEEFNARIRMARRDLADLRHTFELDDYPIDGKTSGEFHLYGPYDGPFGVGSIRLDEVSAYDEPFERASASLRFEGSGVRLDGVQIAKGGGAITGAAWVGWDRRYSFNVDGEQIPVESVVFLQYPQAPLSGVASFTVNGASSFDHPRYDFKGRIADLFLKDEGIGQVTVRLGITDDLMSVGLEAASPRLSLTGSGQMALTRAADSDILFRFTETSIDPYVRALAPGLSPFTRAVASGTLRLVGQLNNPAQLLVSASVDHLDLGLFDYTLRNDGPLRIELDQQNLRLERVKLVGENTELDLSGAVDLPNGRVGVTARGNANLAVLQGFFRDVRSSGRAQLIAEVRGALASPRVDGFAVVTGGRIRHLSLPHAIEQINGRISFGSRGVWFDDVLAKVGLGDRPVRFGGRIALDGLKPGQLSLTATGNDLVLRVADGFRARVDADLALVGISTAPTLRGSVTVKRAAWEKNIDLSAGLLGLAAARAAQGPSSPAAPQASGLPLQYDIRVRAPSSLSIDSNVAQISSTADLTLRGTYDRPLLFGRVEIERGQLFFEGKRYVMQPGGTIDFGNPARIEPEFNLSAETRVRAPGQFYIVTVALSGTLPKIEMQLSSDPPLPQIDVLSLLFNDAAGVEDAELRALVNPQSARRDLALSAASRAGQLLTAPISSGVERVFGLDTVQIRPTIGLDSLQGVSATARLTIGQRLSDRAYITWSKSLDASNRDFIVLVEYDQNDRLSWILSRNEDATYALEVRVRHVF